LPHLLFKSLLDLSPCRFLTKQIARAVSVLLFWLAFAGYSAAQPVLLVPDTAKGCDSLLIEDIILAGNKVTRRPIIMRELDFAKGSKVAVADTGQIIALSRNRLFNTRLFVTISINLLPVAADTFCPRRVVALIEFKERWYIYAPPIFELSDRSINEWYYNQHHDFRRVNFGGRAEINNLRGRAETLKVIAQLGFTRKLEVDYNIPYISKKQRQGLTLNLFHDSDRSFSVASENNKQKFIKDGANSIVWRYRAGLNTSFRSGFYTYHSTGLNFYYSHVNDSVLKVNRDFFYGQLNYQRYFTLHYNFALDRRDIRQYPLHGYYIRTGVEQYVFTNPGYLTSVHAEGGKFFDLGHGFYSAHGASGTLSTPKRQPYSVSRFLGFGQQFVRGYEKYVLDGYANAVLKNTVRYRLFKTTQTLRYMPIQHFRTIPMALYIKGYADAGFVRNPYAAPSNTRLLNTMLVGWGGGLDFVTYYDYVLRLEYSFNRHGESGFFIQVAVEI